MATLNFLRAGGELRALGMNFRKPRLGEYTGGLLEVVFLLVSARGFALFTQQDIGQHRKGLEFGFHFVSVIKMRWKLQMVGFSYDKKSANVVMWKDKEYEYISSK